MMIIYFIFCALIFVQPTTSQSAGLTQKSPNVEIWTVVGFTRESSHVRDGMQEMTTKRAPGTEGEIREGNTQKSPTTESRIHMGTTQESPTTDGRIHDGITQESLMTSTKGTSRVFEGTPRIPNQEDSLREGLANSTESAETAEGTLSLPNVTLTPYRWLCARFGSKQVNVKIHCKCDRLCFLYKDCCYGFTKKTAGCGASVRLIRAQSTSDSLMFPGTNLTETQSNSTTSTSSPNKTSSYIRKNEQFDPVSISLAHQSSCRRSPTLRPRYQQTSLPYMDKYGLSFWMVDQCPSSWLEEESRMKCTDISGTNLIENALLYQPVTEPDTMITFRNKYCATCNGFRNGWEPWELAVYCSRGLADDFANCSSSDCVLRKLKDLNCNGIFVSKPEWNLRTCYREVEDRAFGPCKLTFINGSVRAVPRPRPLHSTLRNACMAYNNPVISHVGGSEESFKNYHCILCYYRELTLCEDQNATPPPERFHGLSFRALLYLGDQDNVQSGGVMTRPEDEQIICPPGFVPDGKDCRPVMYNFTVVKAVVSLHFEPCGWLPTRKDACSEVKHSSQLSAVLRAVQAASAYCRQKHGADNTSIIFVVNTIITLRLRLAYYEESRKIFAQVQASMEKALQNEQLDITGGPVGMRSGSFSACVKNATRLGSVPPFSGATPITTPRQNRGNSHIGNFRLLMLMAMVAAVWDFWLCVRAFKERYWIGYL